MESMLDHAEQANRSVLPLVKAPCRDNLLVLRKKVAIEPFLRSVNLVRNGIINCTSLFGEANDADDGSIYTGRKLLLMSGNRVRQNHPLLVVRTEQGKDAALSAIDSTRHRQYPAQLHALHERKIQCALSAGGVGLAQ